MALTRVALVCAARRRRKTSLKFFSVKTYLNACAKLSYSKYFKRKKLITFPNFIFLFIVIPKQICYDRYFLKIQLSILKTLVMQETRNLLSEDFLSTSKV